VPYTPQGVSSLARDSSVACLRDFLQLKCIFFLTPIANCAVADFRIAFIAKILFHSAKHRIVSVTSKAIVRMPPMISAVIVSHFRHGLRRMMGRRISEQVGCIVVCAVYGFCGLQGGS
jgi:hypothetical protein